MTDPLPRISGEKNIKRENSLAILKLRE